MSLTVSDGEILDNGQPFIAKGINIYADALMNVGAPRLPTPSRASTSSASMCST